MNDAAVQLLLDRAAISDVVHAYATGLDRRDWVLYRSIFLDEIEMDFASVGIRPGAYKADDWVRDARTLFAGFSATQHTSTNHVHEIHGDEATCVSSMQADHFLAHQAGEAPAGPDAERWTIGGYYENELVRRDGSWKLRRVKLVVTWSRGNPEVPRLALRRGRERERGETRTGRTIP